MPKREDSRLQAPSAASMTPVRMSLVVPLPLLQLLAADEVLDAATYEAADEAVREAARTFASEACSAENAG